MSQFVTIVIAFLCVVIAILVTRNGSTVEDKIPTKETIPEKEEPFRCPPNDYDHRTNALIRKLNNKQEKNVIIFGESGVGKSSLINMIFDKPVAKISDKAVGCTFEHQKYSFLNFNLYDTVGVGEPEGGTVSKKDAIEKLLELITELKKSSGINLLILVMKRGRISESLKTNYEMFIKIMTEGKVPAVLVITHADGEKEKNKWYQDNKDHFRKQKMYFSSVTTVCATKGDNMHEGMRCYYEECYSQSRYDVLYIINSEALPEPFQIRTLGLKKKIQSVMNVVFDYFGYPFILWDELQEFLVKQGFSDCEATKKSNALFD